MIETIDHIDLAAWDLFKIDKYIQLGIILTGRGCPYKCILRAVSVVSGARYRIRSTKNVVDEIEYLHNVYKLKYFFS